MILTMAGRNYKKAFQMEGRPLRLPCAASPAVQKSPRPSVLPPARQPEARAHNKAASILLGPASFKIQKAWAIMAAVWSTVYHSMNCINHEQRHEALVVALLD